MIYVLFTFALAVAFVQACPADQVVRVISEVEFYNATDSEGDGENNICTCGNWQELDDCAALESVFLYRPTFCESGFEPWNTSLGFIQSYNWQVNDAVVGRRFYTTPNCSADPAFGDVTPRVFEGECPYAGQTDRIFSVSDSLCCESSFGTAAPQIVFSGKLNNVNETFVDGCADNVTLQFELIAGCSQSEDGSDLFECDIESGNWSVTAFDEAECAGNTIFEAGGDYSQCVHIPRDQDGDEIFVNASCSVGDWCEEFPEGPFEEADIACPGTSLSMFAYHRYDSDCPCGVPGCFSLSYQYYVEGECYYEEILESFIKLSTTAGDVSMTTHTDATCAGAGTAVLQQAVLTDYCGTGALPGRIEQLEDACCDSAVGQFREPSRIESARFNGTCDSLGASAGTAVSYALGGCYRWPPGFGFGSYQAHCYGSNEISYLAFWSDDCSGEGLYWQGDSCDGQDDEVELTYCGIEPPFCRPLPALPWTDVLAPECRPDASRAVILETRYRADAENDNCTCANWQETEGCSKSYRRTVLSAGGIGANCFEANFDAGTYVINSFAYEWNEAAVFKVFYENSDCSSEVFRAGSLRTTTECPDGGVSNEYYQVLEGYCCDFPFEGANEALTAGIIYNNNGTAGCDDDNAAYFEQTLAGLCQSEGSGSELFQCVSGTEFRYRRFNSSDCTTDLDYDTGVFDQGTCTYLADSPEGGDSSILASCFSDGYCSDLPAAPWTEPVATCSTPLALIAEIPLWSSVDQSADCACGDVECVPRSDVLADYYVEGECYPTYDTSAVSSLMFTLDNSAFYKTTWDNDNCTGTMAGQSIQALAGGCPTDGSLSIYKRYEGGCCGDAAPVGDYRQPSFAPAPDCSFPNYISFEALVGCHIWDSGTRSAYYHSLGDGLMKYVVYDSTDCTGTPTDTSVELLSRCPGWLGGAPWVAYGAYCRPISEPVSSWLPLGLPSDVTSSSSDPDAPTTVGTGGLNTDEAAPGSSSAPATQAPGPAAAPPAAGTVTDSPPDVSSAADGASTPSPPNSEPKDTPDGDSAPGLACAAALLTLH